MNKKKSIFIWNRKQAAAAIVATAAILILTAFTAYGSGKDTLGITLGVLLGIAAGAFVLLNIRFGKILSAMLYLLLPLAVDVYKRQQFILDRADVCAAASGGARLVVSCHGYIRAGELPAAAGSTWKDPFLPRAAENDYDIRR